MRSGDCSKPEPIPDQPFLDSGENAGGEFVSGRWRSAGEAAGEPETPLPERPPTLDRPKLDLGAKALAHDRAQIANAVDKA